MKKPKRNKEIVFWSFLQENDRPPDCTPPSGGHELCFTRSETAATTFADVTPGPSHSLLAAFTSRASGRFSTLLHPPKACFPFLYLLLHDVTSKDPCLFSLFFGREKKKALGTRISLSLLLLALVMLILMLPSTRFGHT
jgi:hypothetical protein